MDLFNELGKRYIDPEYRRLKQKENSEILKSRSKSIKLDETIAENKRKWKWTFC